MLFFYFMSEYCKLYCTHVSNLICSTIRQQLEAFIYRLQADTELSYDDLISRKSWWLKRVFSRASTIRILCTCSASAGAA